MVPVGEYFTIHIRRERSLSLSTVLVAKPVLTDCSSADNEEMNCHQHPWQRQVRLSCFSATEALVTQ